MKRALLLGATLCTSCGDPLLLPQVIDTPRVLGARFSVDDDPKRAWPAPGERASVEILAVAPTSSGAHHWALRVCSLAPTRVGHARCEGTPWAEATGAGLDPIRVAFEVPSDEPPEQLAALGALCTDGEPIDGSDAEFACSHESRYSNPFSAEVAVWREGAANRNPSLDLAPLRLGDVELDGTGSAPGDATCAELENVPKIAASPRLRSLSLTLPEDDRERLAPGEHPLNAPREALQISHFSTAGRLDRATTFVEASSRDFPAELSVGWQAPRKVALGGELVRWVVVIRDGRGGSDWKLADVCVVP